MPESNKSEKANLIKDNWIEQRDARGRFMATTTSIEESNNSVSVKESSSSASVEGSTISASIEKVTQVKETTIGETASSKDVTSKHVPPRRNRRKALLPSEIQQIRELIREEDEFDPYAPIPPPLAKLQPLFKEISDKLERESNEQGR